MNPNIALKNFRKNLRKLREANNYSTRKLAKIIGFSQGMIYHYESGRLKPTSYRLLQLCNVFKTTPNELFGYKTDITDKL